MSKLFGSMHGMDHLMSRLLEWMPILAVIGALFRWIFNLKTEIREAHEKIGRVNERLDGIESNHVRLEDKMESGLTEVNRRVDDCKNSILDNLKIVLHAVKNHS